MIARLKLRMTLLVIGVLAIVTGGIVFSISYATTASWTSGPTPPCGC